jgi:hypothetical protein
MLLPEEVLLIRGIWIVPFSRIPGARPPPTGAARSAPSCGAAPVGEDLELARHPRTRTLTRRVGGAPPHAQFDARRLRPGQGLRQRAERVVRGQLPARSPALAALCPTRHQPERRAGNLAVLCQVHALRRPHAVQAGRDVLHSPAAPRRGAGGMPQEEGVGAGQPCAARISSAAAGAAADAGAIRQIRHQPAQAASTAAAIVPRLRGPGVGVRGVGFLR